MIMLTAWATDKYNIGHIIWHILYGLGRTREIFAQKNIIFTRYFDTGLLMSYLMVHPELDLFPAGLITLL